MHELTQINKCTRDIRSPTRPLKAAVIAGILALACAACRPVQAVGDGAAIPVSEPAVASAQETPVVQPEVQTVATSPDVTPAAQPTEPAEVGAEEEAGGGALDEALVAQGLVVYRAQYCGICHTLAAAGTFGQFGPAHDGIGSAAGARIAAPNYSGNATTAEEYLYESLVKPEVYIVDGFASSPHRMPPYTHLGEEELRALTAFLLAQQ